MTAYAYVVVQNWPQTLKSRVSTREGQKSVRSQTNVTRLIQPQNQTRMQSGKSNCTQFFGGSSLMLSWFTFSFKVDSQRVHVMPLLALGTIHWPTG